ncbi:MAG: 30S ribosomal protein S2 [bacterium]
MPDITLQQLLMSGAHFGHVTRRWNPKMKPYIFMKKNNIHIIDLNKSLHLLLESCKQIAKIVENGEKILFVGTKKQAKDIIKVEAERCEMPYVNERWLGGTLTNYVNIKKSIKHLKNLEKMEVDGTFDKLTKKEVLMIEREKVKLEKTLGGIKELKKIPGALFIVDTNNEYIAVNEANKLDIPIFGVIDTNCDPDPIDYIIPANDDAFKSISLLVRTVTDTIIEAKTKLKMKEEKQTAEKEQSQNKETIKKGTEDQPTANKETIKASEKKSDSNKKPKETERK